MRKNWSSILEKGLVQTGFTEETSPVSKNSEIDSVDIDFEMRLMNWGRITNPKSIYSGSSGASTFWAQKYVEFRNNREKQLAISCGVLEKQNVLKQIENEVFSEAEHDDALLIEKAWSSLVDYQQKKILKMRYVDRLPDTLIRRNLNLRGMKNLSLILWRSKENLKNYLSSEKKPVIINPELNRINQVNYNLNRRKRA